jgi:diaminohydroxyphosphoribosylaminopyrimidine deaminase/5-amino-6-(5-phosphoribosylamino)uracil reductase
MQLALSLAKKGGIRVRPNPLVGAVIARHNAIIGTGYHKQYGKAHAEINALNTALTSVKNASLYVTLEPCNHVGKTPPCTQTIINAGIKKVIIAMKDPNPLVAGKGITHLRKHGIDVSIGLLQKEAENLNRVFIKNITKQEPYVILKMAETLDGKIASYTGDSKWVSGEKSRDIVYQWRSESEGILVGLNTIIKDNPQLSSHGKGRDPLRIAIDPHNKITNEFKIYDNKSKSLIISYNTFKKYGIFNGKTVNLKKLMKYLYKIGIYQLLIEGGGELNASAFNYDIVDEIRFFIAPKIVGGRKAITPVEGRGIPYMKDAITINEWSCEKTGEDFLIKGFVSCLPA